MNIRATLSTLALTGVLVSSAWAGSPPVVGSDDLSRSPRRGSVVRPEPMKGDTLDQASTTIEGQVAGIEHETGRLVLDTELGPFTLTTEPEKLAGIEVGDTVRVSFVADSPILGN
jgi:hypothetical protein